MSRSVRSLPLSFAAVGLLVGPASGQLHIADLGACDLELGGVIEDCQLAYRTYGELDERRSNAVLIPTWFTGRSSDWLSMLGPDGAVDTTTHFVVVVESLGAGSSSSPVTSGSHPGAAFPEITVGDMVATARRLVLDELGLPSLYAVVGVSLGGFQAFEWAVRYPEMVERIVPIVGTPRQAPFQRILWQLIAEASHEAASADEPNEEALDRLAHLLVLVVTSPEDVNDGSYEEQIAQQRAGLREAELFEWAWQARAIVRYDAASDFAGAMDRAVERWEGVALVVVAEHDHSVSPGPALDFADLVGAETLVMPESTGHVAFFSHAAAQRRVREFLAR